jgi:hypothetical protein
MHKRQCQTNQFSESTTSRYHMQLTRDNRAENPCSVWPAVIICKAKYKLEFNNGKQISCMFL